MISWANLTMAISGFGLNEVEREYTAFSQFYFFNPLVLSPMVFILTDAKYDGNAKFLKKSSLTKKKAWITLHGKKSASRIFFSLLLIKKCQCIYGIEVRVTCTLTQQLHQNFRGKPEI